MEVWMWNEKRPSTSRQAGAPPDLPRDDHHAASLSAFQTVVTWIHSSCVHHGCTVPHMRTRAASLLTCRPRREGG